MKMFVVGHDLAHRSATVITLDRLWSFSVRQTKKKMLSTNKSTNINNRYNCICLAFALWSLVLIANDRPLFGAVAYCCAVNYKQMTLYYAPAIAVKLFFDALKVNHNINNNYFR